MIFRFWLLLNRNLQLFTLLRFSIIDNQLSLLNRLHKFIQRSLTTISVWLFLYFRLFFSFNFGFYYFYVVATTGEFVLLKPPVLWPGWHIPRSFNYTKKWGYFCALSIAKPHMLSTLVNFVMKCMINRKFKPSYFVYSTHFAYEIFTMSVYPIISFVFVFS